LIANKAMVVSTKKPQNGVEIMKKAEMHLTPWWLKLALAVAYPYAGNLGGGGLWSTESQWRNRNFRLS
jgi:gamma-glutamyltranspeptidase/glutathione hydrolase